MASEQEMAAYIFYSSLGVILIIPFIFRPTANFLVNVVGFVYPTFASLCAILRKDDRKIRRWLIYWIIYGLFFLVQRLFDFILRKIPMYPLIQAAILMLFMHYPYEEYENFAEYLYSVILAPNVGKAAIKADDAINDAVTQIQQDPNAFAEKLISVNDNSQSIDQKPSSSPDDVSGDNENQAKRPLYDLTSKMLTLNNNTEGGETQEEERKDGAGAEETSEVEAYKRTSGEENAKLIEESDEVLRLRTTSVEDDVDIDVDDVEVCVAEQPSEKKQQ